MHPIPEAVPSPRNSSNSNALAVVGHEVRVFNEGDQFNAGESSDGVTRLDSTQTLEPGYYWTALREVGGDGKADSHFNVGEMLLLVDVIEFENRVHSVKMRVHPKHGERTFIMMVEDFVKAFEPCPDSESVRQQEQKSLMKRVAEIQDELMRTQMDPQLMIEAVKSDVEKEIAKSDGEEQKIHARESEKQAERDVKFAKIHRRASRRSAAKGNPLAVPKATLASEVGTIIAHGIDASGVAELARLAGHQVIIATAQGNWLKKKTDQISETLKSLTPYMSERAAVAMARSSGALKMAERIKRGIESLDLYTGRGVDVFDVRTGEPAPTTEPLTLIQGKRFMEEELAVWADVSSTFDFSSKDAFFKALAENTQLLDQVLPTPRCVVTVAVLRRKMDYTGSDALTAAMYNQQNQLVFLLVRNGENVHVVYSSTPSHEGASRLFPTQDELEKPFRGWDGSKVSIRDIEFGKAAAEFDDIALCYKRFLILLCGLDHRLKLMGDFYPEHEQMQFMSAEFQDRYFDFVADDDTSRLIGDSLLPFSEWMDEHNKMLQSGSRIFVLPSGAKANGAEFKRRSGLSAGTEQFKAPFIALKEGLRFVLRVQSRDRYSLDEVHVKCELNAQSSSEPWWLCVDAVSLRDVQSYRFSRHHRSMGVGYLRLLRRVEAFLIEELAQEEASRAYLLDTAVTLGGLDAIGAVSMLNTAVRNWRAARRGQRLADVDDKQALNEVLSLMVPEGRLPGNLQKMVDAHLTRSCVTPLLLTRSGKSKLFLYVEPTEEDKAPYPNVLSWGWAKRVTLEAGKTKLRETSSILLWLGTALPASETEVKRWDAAKAWMHESAEPVPLRKYKQIPELLMAAQTDWAPILKAGKGSGIPESLFSTLLNGANAIHRKVGRADPVLLHIPVAVTGSKNGRFLETVYFTCRVESALVFYGNTEQSERVRDQYIRRYVNRSAAQERVDRMKWSLRSSSEHLTIAHNEAGEKNAGHLPAWSLREISVCQKGRPFFDNKSKAPRWSESKVALSPSHAFDELMRTSVKAPKRLFYKEKAAQVLHAKTWPFYSKEVSRANILAASSKRFEVDAPAIRAQCNSLVWSAERSRSNANSNFSRALILSAENK